MKNTRAIIGIAILFTFLFNPLLVKAQVTQENTKFNWSVMPGPLYYRTATGATVLGDDIYVLGQWSPRVLNRFHPATLKWSAISETPHEYFTNDMNVQLVTVNNDLYAVNEKHLARFTVDTGQWSLLADPPSVRSSTGFVAHSFNEKLFIIGGYRYVTDARKDEFPASIKDVSVFDPTNGTWASGPDLPTELGSVRVAEWAGHLIVAGTSALWPGYRLYALSEDGAGWQDFGLARSLMADIKFMYGVGERLYFINQQGVVSYEEWNGQGLPVMLNVSLPCQFFSMGGIYPFVVYDGNLYILGGSDAHLPITCGSGKSVSKISYWGGLVLTFGPDADGDNLLDSFELRLGTDPTKADSDGDGYSDTLELLANYDPVTPAAPVDIRMVQRYRGRFVIDANDALWYVDPVSSRRYRIDGNDYALSIVQTFGLGVTDATLNGMPTVGGSGYGPQTLSGRILIQVQQNGRAWYVRPEAHRQRVALEVGDGLYQQLRSFASEVSPVELRGIPAGSQAYLRFYNVLRPMLRQYPATFLYGINLIPRNSPYLEVIESGGRLGK